MTSQKIAKRAIYPSASVSFGLDSNKYDNERSEAIQNAAIDRDNSSYTLGLSLSWTIGAPQERIDKAKAALNYHLNLKKSEALRKNLLEREKHVLRQIKDLKINIASIKRRIQLSRKALSEYNKLYKKGRVDLDQVIRSEESLIATEIGHMRSLAQKEELLYSLSSLYGITKQFILN